MALSSHQQSIIHQLHLLTGREDRKIPCTDSQNASMEAVLPVIEEPAGKGLQPQARCDVVNRILITLAIKPMTYDFFGIVLEPVHFNHITELEEAVSKFRTLCMLEFGNFKYGYRVFNGNAVLLRSCWDRNFPTSQMEDKRASDLGERPEPAGLVEVPKDRLFALGYIASERAPSISAARKMIKPLLIKARSSGVADWKALVDLSHSMGVKDLKQQLGKAAIPDVELLWGGPIFLGSKSFLDVLNAVASSCTPVDEAAIKSAQESGLQNTATYLAMHDLDVYVATSMREPVHFTTNHEFVHRLFHEGQLRDLKIRYFDPTQSHLENRIQKGLLECLMIKRASVTVYNAQESDTFGKDSELGVTLAQRKPAIVYVGRILADEKSVQPVYEILDSTVRGTKDDLIDAILSRKLLSSSEVDPLRAPEKSKNDVVTKVILSTMPEIIGTIEEDYLSAELVQQGYSLEDAGDKVNEFCVKKILKLEQRALTFRDVHPLSLQTSPLDGVARGVFVTRSVQQTAQVLLLLLRGTMRYTIKEEKDNWLLFDDVTHSPVRVVTKNKVLTAAFWSEPWGVTDLTNRDRFARVKPLTQIQ